MVESLKITIVAKNAKRIIDNKGLKQLAVAKRMGIEYRTFNNMLNGRKIITADDVELLVKALEITPNDLFIDSKPNNSTVCH